MNGPNAPVTGMLHQLSDMVTSIRPIHGKFLDSAWSRSTADRLKVMPRRERRPCKHSNPTGFGIISHLDQFRML